jgi:hypothetical protein
MLQVIPNVKRGVTQVKASYYAFLELYKGWLDLMLEGDWAISSGLDNIVHIYQIDVCESENRPESGGDFA